MAAPDTSNSDVLFWIRNYISMQLDSAVTKHPLKRKDNASRKPLPRLQACLCRHAKHPMPPVNSRPLERHWIPRKVPKHSKAPRTQPEMTIPRLRNSNPIPFQASWIKTTLSWHEPCFQERLTHVQVLFTWKPSPLRSSKFSFEYLLLPPRSALAIVPRMLTHSLQNL